jgi:hypothetical protein
VLDVSENTRVDHESPALTDHITEAEDALSEEIATLWASHTDCRSIVKRTRAELKNLRRTLGQRLHMMKALVVRTGRNGGWATFLRSHSLPRASADRYVCEHELTLHPLAPNRLSEEVPATVEADVRRFVQSLLPRLYKVLSTNEAVYYFLDELVSHLPVIDSNAAGQDVGADSADSKTPIGKNPWETGLDPLAQKHSWRDRPGSWTSNLLV